MKINGMNTIALILTTAVLAATASAQQFPPLTIAGTTIDANVTFDGTRGVYRYAYTVHAPAANKASIDGFKIDITGRVDRPQNDPSLQGNAIHREHGPGTTIPVAFTVPDAAVWRAGTTPRGWAFFYTIAEGHDILPGSSAAGFAMESHFPPAVRSVEVSPSADAWDAIEEQMTGEVENPPDASQYKIVTTTLAPADPQESDYFDGGGQSPANVNPFLRYLSPKESRTKLSPGTTSYWVIIAYGATTQPATFSATFNGANITSSFHPVPGSVEAIRLALSPGSNKAQFSIEGATSSGRIARDTDTLTLIVQ